MMASIFIRLASRSFRVEAGTARLAALQQYFASHALESDSSQSADGIFRWEGDRLHAADPVREFPAHGDAQGLLLLQLLIFEHLFRLEPTLIALHGNVLSVEGSTGRQPRALALVGQSQSGKSSQTSALLDALGNRACIHAEDVILLDLEKEIIWPYARAATVRPPDGGAERLVPHARHTVEAIPLSLLTDWFHLPFAEKEEATGELLAVSHLTAPAREQLAPHARISEDKSGFLTLQFAAPPSETQWAEWLTLLEKEGVLVLWAGKDDAIGRPRAFPADPNLALVPYSQAHPSFVRALVRLRRQSTAERGHTLFRLACAVGNAEHWNLQPGGTPRRTARLLLDALGLDP